MSTFQDEMSGPVSKVQRVRQAANMLGISERTVYRRLRSGKLEQLPAADAVTDDVVSGVSDASLADAVISRILPITSDVSSQIDMTCDKLAALCQELEVRDRQIQSLLENQQELMRTIQNLQTQIYELARLALSQTAQVEEKPPTHVVPVVGSADRSNKGLRSWIDSLRGRGRDA